MGVVAIGAERHLRLPDAHLSFRRRAAATARRAPISCRTSACRPSSLSAGFARRHRRPRKAEGALKLSLALAEAAHPNVRRHQRFVAPVGQRCAERRLSRAMHRRPGSSASTMPDTASTTGGYGSPSYRGTACVVTGRCPRAASSGTAGPDPAPRPRPTRRPERLGAYAGLLPPRPGGGGSPVPCWPRLPRGKARLTVERRAPCSPV